MLHRRLRELCDRFQLPEPRSDTEGGVSVSFGGAPELHIVPFPNGALLDCVVASFSTGKGRGAERNDLCRAALRMSLSRTLREWTPPLLPYLAATDSDLRLQARLRNVSGAWGDAGREMSPLADQARFERVIEQFLNVAEIWQTLLAKKCPGPPQESSLPPWASVWP